MDSGLQSGLAGEDDIKLGNSKSSLSSNIRLVVVGTGGGVAAAVITLVVSAFFFIISVGIMVLGDIDNALSSPLGTIDMELLGSPPISLSFSSRPTCDNNEAIPRVVRRRCLPLECKQRML